MNIVNQSQTILIVDDSDDDYDATARALRKDKNLKNPLHRCEDGKEALDYLFRRGAYSDLTIADRPGIILLDLNMPRLDGREALSIMKSDSDLRRIPVVVLTTSKADEDIVKSYDLGANSYIVKPVTFEALVDILQTLEKYWFQIVERSNR